MQQDDAVAALVVAVGVIGDMAAGGDGLADHPRGVVDDRLARIVAGHVLAVDLGRGDLAREARVVVRVEFTTRQRRGRGQGRHHRGADDLGAAGVIDRVGPVPVDDRRQDAIGVLREQGLEVQLVQQELDVSGIEGEGADRRHLRQSPATLYAVGPAPNHIGADTE